MTDIKEIRNDMVQYVAKIIELSEHEGKEAAQIAVAELNTLALEFAKKEQKDDTNTVYEFYVGKPILRAAILLLKDRYNGIQKEIGGQFSAYEECIHWLERIVESIKE